MRSFVFASVWVLCACGEDVAVELVGNGAPVHRSLFPSAVSEARPTETRTTYDAPLHPAPLSGGTLLVLSDGRIASADPDYDSIWVTARDLQSTETVKLPLGVEVGRMAEDGAHRLHVVLRGTGELADVDVSSGQPTLLGRRAVCPAPRGIAWRSASDELLVACATGELVTLPATGGEIVSVQELGGDLRDVIVRSTDVVVTRFRSAELVHVDPSGGIIVTPIPTASFSLNPMGGFDGGFFGGDAGTASVELAAEVAWRAVPAANDGILVVHQRGTTRPLSISSGFADAGFGGNAYGGGSNFCQVPTVLGNAITLVAGDGTQTTKFVGGTLPIDGALDVSTGQIVVALAGQNQVAQLNVNQLQAPGPCSPSVPPPGPMMPQLGTPVAVANPGGSIVVLLRSPPRLVYGAYVIALPIEGARPKDVGLDMFHTATPSGLACASCHPEGREDGRVWNFIPGGPRRTQTVAGGISATAPFHWDGSEHSFDALMNDVLVGRMGAPSPSEAQRAALLQWVDSIPRPEVLSLASSSVTRGADLFRDVNVGCTTCHSGARFTNNLDEDVGTGAAFQVPSLIGVAARAPYMHDGCAKTLEERFGPCGGARHGNTAQLTAQDVTDLVAYLKTL